MNRNLIINFAIFSLILSLLGCSTLKAYHGTLPPHQVAILTEQSYTSVFIEKVDRFKLGYFHDTVELLPGKHVVQVKLMLPSGPADETGFQMQSYQKEDIAFEAVAGRTYTIEGLVKGSKYWLWIEDVVSGKVVGGHKP
jgi:hypothetical protein